MNHPSKSTSQLTMAALSLTLMAACAVNSPQLMQTAFKGLHQKSAQMALNPADFIQIPSPNQGPRPAGVKIDAIILHHTATAANARQVGAYFAKPSSKTSAHYIVDRTGYIVQPVADHLNSWHAGRSEYLGKPNVNDFSIGIEICNLGDSQEPYSDIQYDSVIRLVAYLMDKHQIPLEHITRHRDVAIPPGRKIDTSNNFSVTRVLDGVRALQAGTYIPPNPNTPLPDQPIPAFKEVKVGASTPTMQDLADVYLDNPQRWIEIQALNPELNPEKLSVGQKVKLPTQLNHNLYH